MVQFKKAHTDVGQGSNKNLVNPTPPAQSLDSVPGNAQHTSGGNANGSRGASEKKNRNVKASTKKSGRRVGGKNTNRTKRGDPSSTKGAPYPVPPINGGNPSVTTSSVNSDFGFNIAGQAESTKFGGVRDNTLFKDWNRKAKAPVLATLESSNAVTNYVKSMNIDFKESIKDPTYLAEWNLCSNDMIRDIIRNTNAAKGAMDVATKDAIAEYIHEVSKLFTLEYELDVMMSWNPAEHHDTNAAIRHLAASLATDHFMTEKTKMREVLRSTVLPEPMLKYLRWLREYKLVNEMPESSKTCFRTLASLNLINQVYNTLDPSSSDVWQNTINASVDAVRNLDPRVPALLLDKVDCINFVMVKDYFSDACNRATYDPEFNNLFNNRLWVRGSGTGANALFPQSIGGTTALMALNTVTPLALALTNLGTQLDKTVADLPMENKGGPKVYKPTGSVLEFTHFFAHDATNPTTAQPYGFKAVQNWYESGDDSTFMIEDGTAVSGIATARGDTLEMFYAGNSNVNMAKRMSFHELFY